MRNITFLALVAMMLVSCRDDDKRPSYPPPQPQSGWIIGPIIGGKNYSVGMPETLDAANGFTFPTCGQGSVHYVTKSSGGFDGLMRLTYRLSGVQVQPVQGTPPAVVSLYFESNPGDWSGNYPDGRWYRAGNPLDSGDGTFTVEAAPDQWTNVMGQPAQVDGVFKPQFQQALQGTTRVGFVFGSPKDGATGHGACGAGRFEVTGFTP